MTIDAMFPKKDVRLKNAIILWQSGVCCPDVLVIDKESDENPRRFMNNTGACMTWWRDETDERRLQMLFIEAWRIVIRDGVSPKLLHEALLVIPEYRVGCSILCSMNFSNSPF